MDSSYEQRNQYQFAMTDSFFLLTRLSFFDIQQSI
jgi:hypothetical protein